MYYPDDQRRTVFLYGDFRTISRKNIYGGKETADISGEREVLTAMV